MDRRDFLKSSSAALAAVTLESKSVSTIEDSTSVNDKLKFVGRSEAWNRPP
jgi:hypothetical protein